MRKGDIYYVDLGTSKGSEQAGNRPVIVLYKGENGNTVTAALTTKKKKILPVHIELLPEETGLKHPSLVLLEQIIFIPEKNLKNKLGYLKSHQKWEKIRQGLKISLGL